MPDANGQIIKVPLSIFQEHHIVYVEYPKHFEYSEQQILRKIEYYFRLDTDIKPFICKWKSSSRFVQEVLDNGYFSGIRLLRQDPVETLFAFICSQNNAVTRIKQMVMQLCEHFGTSVDGLQSFPSISCLCLNDVEGKLNKLKFGYRSKYIARAAIFLSQEGVQDGESFLNVVDSSGMNVLDYLQRIEGVGRKVADCVALMAFEGTHIVPIDTHMRKIASHLHFISVSAATSKYMSAALYERLKESYRSLLGDYAGWAHLILFAHSLHQKAPLKTLK